MAPPRITNKKLLNDLINIVNLKRGIPFTLWQTLKNPGKAIRIYLKEDRTHFVNSFRILSILVAINTFLTLHLGLLDSLTSKINVTIEGEIDESKSDHVKELIAKAFEDASSWLSFLMVPVIGFFTYWFFRKSEYNFAEHTTAQAYLMALTTALGIIFIPFAVYDFEVYTWILSLQWFAYTVWFCLSLPSTKKLYTRILASLGSIILGYLVFSVVLYALIAAIIVIKIKLS